VEGVWRVCGECVEDMSRVCVEGGHTADGGPSSMTSMTDTMFASTGLAPLHTEPRVTVCNPAIDIMKRDTVLHGAGA